MNVGSSTVYTRPEGETTEWEDILRAKGITQPTEAELEKKALEEIERAAEEAKESIDPLSLKSLEELELAAEEDDEFADSRILESYRNKRLAEIKAAAEKNKYGRIFPLARCDFVREVTEDSKNAWVVVFLYQDHITDSKILANVLTRFAAKVKYIKLMSIRADSCIENYPDKNVPTLLFYHGGELHSQIVTLAELGGRDVNEEILEWVFAKKGAMKTELLDDPREKLADKPLSRGYSRHFGSRRHNSDSDSDY